MTVSPHRKRRAAKTQAVVAEYLQTRGWPFAESTGGGRQGADVTGTPDISVEVKARAAFDPLAWLRQAEAAAKGRLPFAVTRCNGQGEDAANYVALIRFGDLVELLNAAGFGSHPEPNLPPVYRGQARRSTR